VAYGNYEVYRYVISEITSGRSGF